MRKRGVDQRRPDPAHGIGCSSGGILGADGFCTSTTTPPDCPDKPGRYLLDLFPHRQPRRCRALRQMSARTRAIAGFFRSTNKRPMGSSTPCLAQTPKATNGQQLGQRGRGSGKLCWSASLPGREPRVAGNAALSGFGVRQLGSLIDFRLCAIAVQFGRAQEKPPSKFGNWAGGMRSFPSHGDLAAVDVTVLARAAIVAWPQKGNNRPLNSRLRGRAHKACRPRSFFARSFCTMGISAKAFGCGPAIRAQESER